MLQGERIGIPPEQLPAILKAATDPLERLNAAQNENIKGLERQLGATREQIIGFFRIIDEANVPDEAIGTRLFEIAERHKALLAQATAMPGDDPATAGLRTELRAALEKPDLERADALLADIQMAQDSDIERRVLQAAATCAQRGEVAMTRLRYYEAASHFSAAAARVSPAHEAEHIDYLFKQAAALYAQGDEFGDNAALAEAIRLDRDALKEYTRKRVPLQWALTQMNLGGALLSLGERESGTARLEEAVTACRAALETFTAAKADYYIDVCRQNLDGAQARLAEGKG